MSPSSTLPPPDPAMVATAAAIPRCKLGASDLEVPLLCLGTMTWGEQSSEEEAHRQLDYCVSLGLNFLDTAELYPVPPRAETVGRTETYIGNWLEKRGCRDKVIIATKVASYLPAIDRSWVVANRTDPPTLNAPQPLLDRANIRAAIEGSLRRLRTSYVDLYQLHWPARYVPKWGDSQYRSDHEYKHEFPSYEEQVSAIGELIKEGKVRHWGLSNETSYGVCKFIETAQRLGIPPPITIQNDFSITYRDYEKELAETCAPSHCNVSLLAYGVLAGGALSDKYLNGDLPADARHRLFPKFQARYCTRLVLDAAHEYAALAKQEGITLAQLALAWAASRWYMGSVIIGANSLEQLKENIAAFTVQLSPETLQAMEEVHHRRQNPQIAD